MASSVFDIDWIPDAKIDVNTLPYEFDLPDNVDPDDFDAVVDYLYNETGCTATAYRDNRDPSVEPTGESKKVESNEIQQSNIISQQEKDDYFAIGNLNDPYWDFN